MIVLVLSDGSAINCTVVAEPCEAKKKARPELEIRSGRAMTKIQLLGIRSLHPRLPAPEARGAEDQNRAEKRHAGGLWNPSDVAIGAVGCPRSTRRKYLLKRERVDRRGRNAARRCTCSAGSGKWTHSPDRRRHAKEQIERTLPSLLRGAPSSGNSRAVSRLESLGNRGEIDVAVVDGQCIRQASAAGATCNERGQINPEWRNTGRIADSNFNGNRPTINRARTGNRASSRIGVGRHGCATRVRNRPIVCDRRGLASAG